jgi:D-glycero-beta-D-manno-heptose-7-phosphate kinase
MSKAHQRPNQRLFTSAPTDCDRSDEILSRFSNVKALVVGDFILDEFVWGSVDRISPEAPVPVVNVERESFVPGGALNVANNIRTLGGSVIPCGVLGRDLRGRLVAKLMRAEGIETEGIIYDASRPTTLKTRVIAHSQQMVRFDREVTRELDTSQRNQVLQFIEKTLPSVDIVILEDYGKGMIDPKLLTHLLKLARSEGKTVVVDPKEKHFSYYKGATVITPNRKEAIGASGLVGEGQVPKIEDVGKVLVEKLATDAVLITLGEQGMILVERSGAVTKIPTAAKQVYDVSGAGDTVIAIFSMALAAGATKKEAAQLANLGAGIVVGKVGTATVSMAELQSACGIKTSSKKRKELARV